MTKTEGKNVVKLARLKVRAIGTHLSMLEMLVSQGLPVPELAARMREIEHEKFELGEALRPFQKLADEYNDQRWRRTERQVEAVMGESRRDNGARPALVPAARTDNGLRALGGQVQVGGRFLLGPAGPQDDA